MKWAFWILSTSQMENRVPAPGLADGSTYSLASPGTLVLPSALLKKILPSLMQKTPSAERVAACHAICRTTLPFADEERRNHYF
jgi:hypothetical protein